MILDIRTTTNGHWHTAKVTAVQACVPADDSVELHAISMFSYSAAFRLATRIFGAGRFYFTMLRRGFYRAESRQV